MNLLHAEAAELVGQLAKEFATDPGCRVVVFPPYTSIAAVREVLGGAVHLGAQDLHWEAKGAFTGEVSAAMLVDAGCSHVLIGHSERRQYFGETDDSVAKKLRAALAAGLYPIVCVGETLAERDGGKVEEVLRRQVTGAFSGIEPTKRFAVAYEPVWAIGTGRTATPEQAADAHRTIRDMLGGLLGAGSAASTPILYGGSVTPENAAALLAQSEIDGALVGGASLRFDSFARIVRAREVVQQ